MTDAAVPVMRVAGVAGVLIHVSDPPAATAWYARAFQQSRPTVLENGFEVLTLGSVQLEIVLADGKVGAGPSGSIVYWLVDDFESALGHMTSVGATLYRGPMKIEHGMSMCQVRDPWGNCIGLRGPSRPDAAAIEDLEARPPSHPGDTMEPDDSAGEACVRSFFDALDRRDVDAVAELFAPTGVVVHHDGVRTTVREFQDIMQRATRWPVRRRTLSQFEFVRVDQILIVGCRNEISVLADDGEWGTTTYAETWILERLGSGMRALRCHYSRVTADEHREDLSA